MARQEWLDQEVEENRSHLLAVAYRMLGSVSEADEAVQESWLRLSRSETGDIENMGAWLTTVIARICLDMLRIHKSRREESFNSRQQYPIASRETGIDPEHKALLADFVGLAMLVVLDTLTPAERLAFVLHDMFAVSFDEIATIIGRSSDATRQLASRGHRKVQGANQGPGGDSTRQREVVAAFLAASRESDFAILLSLLDPDAVVRADAAAVTMGAASEVQCAAAVADSFSGRARFAQPALIGGVAGAAWTPGGQPRVVLAFTVTNGKISAIDRLADPELLRELDLTILVPPTGAL